MFKPESSKVLCMFCYSEKSIDEGTCSCQSFEGARSVMTISRSDLDFRLFVEILSSKSTKNVH